MQFGSAIMGENYMLSINSKTKRRPQMHNYQKKNKNLRRSACYVLVFPKRKISREICVRPRPQKSIWYSSLFHEPFLWTLVMRYLSIAVRKPLENVLKKVDKLCMEVEGGKAVKRKVELDRYGQYWV